MKVARWMRVAPWELLEQPVVWRFWGAMAMAAETDAMEQKRASEQRKAENMRKFQR